MDRTDLERLSKAELIDLVLRLQQPAKTSRTSSRLPSTDRKAQRDKSRPGGAKLGHPGHSRRLSEDFAVSTLASRRRAVERTLQDILDTPTPCDLARVVQNKFRRAS